MPFYIRECRNKFWFFYFLIPSLFLDSTTSFFYTRLLKIDAIICYMFLINNYVWTFVKTTLYNNIYVHIWGRNKKVLFYSRILQWKVRDLHLLLIINTTFITTKEIQVKIICYNISDVLRHILRDSVVFLSKMATTHIYIYLWILQISFIINIFLWLYVKSSYQPIYI